MYNELEDEKPDIQDGVVDRQEEVETETDESEDTEIDDSNVDDWEESEEVEDEIDESGEVINPKESTKQSPEENAQFKSMRLKAEQAAEKKYEAQKKEIQDMRLDLEQKKSEKLIKDDMLTTDKIYEYADKEGVTEEVARRLLELEAQKVIDSDKVIKAENFNKTQEAKKKLSKSKYFKLLESDVDEVLVQHPDANYEDVYKHMLGSNIDELEKKLTSSVEKRTIDNIHDRARRRSVGSSAGGSADNVDETASLDYESLAMTNAFGNDTKEIAKYVKKNSKNKKGR